MRIAILLCTSVLASSTILRIPCLEYGKFSIIKKNAALQGSLLATFSDTSVDDCEDRCLLDDRCKTVNIKDDDKTCELNSKSADDPSDKVSVVEKIGWTYRSTNYSETQIGELCQDIKPCQDRYICKDTCTFPGYECIPNPTDCKDLYANGVRTKRVFTYDKTHFPFPVYCDTVTLSRLWVVFQRRVDASTDFFRGWSAYKAGFGELNGNFWLGLEKLHQLAPIGRGAMLRVEVKHVDLGDNLYYAQYINFGISDEADGFRLSVDGYSGTAGDALSHHNGMLFSTKDKDNDEIGVNCADAYKGAWWYRSCHLSNLNGLVASSSAHGHAKYMTWLQLEHNYGRIFYSEMKLCLH